MGEFIIGTSITWAGFTGTWAAATGTWDSYRTAGTPVAVFVDTSGNSSEDTRSEHTTERMIWESKDWLFGHAARLTEFRIQAKGGEFEVSYSINGGSTWSDPVTLTPDSAVFQEMVVYVNFTCQKVRLRIRSDSEQLEVKWIEPWYIQRERSQSLYD